MNAQWVTFGTDHFLFVQQDGGEWHRVGEVHRRQIYAALPVAFHGFVADRSQRCYPTDASSDDWPRGLAEAGAYTTVEEARAVVERRYRYFLLFSFRLPPGSPTNAGTLDLSLASHDCQVL